MNNLEIWREALAAPKKGILTLHVNHDGDSIASNLALARVLRERGHDVTIVSGEQPKREFAFLAGFDDIRVCSLVDISWDSYEVFWALDMSSPSRVGADIEYPPSLRILVLDHHQTNQAWRGEIFLDAYAPSTTAVLARLFTDLDIDLDSDLATCLLTGVATDTGFFSHAADARPFRIASELMHRGADYRDILFRINQQAEIPLLQAIGRGLSAVKVYEESAMAVFTVPHTDSESNPLLDDPEWLAKYAFIVHGTDFGVVLVEERPADIRVELRARKPQFDVSAIAVKLGGGGHQARAGAQLACNLDEAIMQVRDAAQQVRGSARRLRQN